MKSSTKHNIITSCSEMNGASTFGLYLLPDERESEEVQVMGAYLKRRIFITGMSFTFLAWVMGLLTDEDSLDTSDGGTIYNETDSDIEIRPQKQVWLIATCRY